MQASTEMATPLVSVVMPAFNAERWISAAVDSVLQQDYPHLELIVVDDASTDGTRAIVAGYDDNRIRLLSNSGPKGAPGARNAGLEAARGDLVKFFDADDLLQPGALGREVTAIQALGPEDVVFGGALRGEINRPLGIDEKNAPMAASADPALRMVCFLLFNLQTAQPLHRKALLRRVNGFLPGLQRAQEYDLHIRLAAAGVRFHRIPEVSVWVRDHDSPDRISNAQSGWRQQAAQADEAWANHQRWRALVEEAVGGPLPPRAAAKLALGAWKRVRFCVQKGRPDVAQRFAEAAAELDPAMAQVQGALYRRAARILGPVRAEQAFIMARRVLRGASSSGQ